MKGREVLGKTAIQDVAGRVSGSLTWSHFRVYAAPRFAAIGMAIEKGGGPRVLGCITFLWVINGNDLTVIRHSI